MGIKAIITRNEIPNIILVGGTACGKSSIGRLLALHLGFGVLDIDDFLEKRSGKKISQIFKERGEKAFRELESEFLESISDIKSHVIVTGAGIVESKDCFDLLKNIGTVVWLSTPMDELVGRLILRPDELKRRPLLADALKIEKREERERFLIKKLNELNSRRIDYYKRADYTVINSYSTPDICSYFIKTVFHNIKSSDENPN